MPNASLEGHGMAQAMQNYPNFDEPSFSEAPKLGAAISEHIGFAEGLTDGSRNRTDSIVRAATDAFCAPRRRSPQEITVYAQLVRPLLPKVSRETMRWMSALLSHCNFAPSETCRVLANQSISIAAPILVSASKLSINDQIEIAKNKSREHRELLAQRTNVSSPVIDVIIEKAEVEPIRHLVRSKPHAFTIEHARKALTIIACAMGEAAEAAESAEKLSTPEIANTSEPAPTIAKSHPVDLTAPEQPATNVVEDSFAELRKDVAARSEAMNRAREELVALASKRRQGSAAESVSQDRQDHSINLLAMNAVEKSGAQQEENSTPAFAATSISPNNRPVARTIPAAKSGSELRLAAIVGTLDAHSLQETLAQALSLSPARVGELISEDNLELLCVALRAVECEADLAKRTLNAVHMLQKRDHVAISKLETAFGALDLAECKKALHMWQTQAPAGISNADESFWSLRTTRDIDPVQRSEPHTSPQDTLIRPSRRSEADTQLAWLSEADRASLETLMAEA